MIPMAEGPVWRANYRPVCFSFLSRLERLQLCVLLCVLCKPIL